MDTMLPAILLFAAAYVLMRTFSRSRPYIALASGAIFILTGIGILRKEGHTVSNGDFFKIGLPFTLAAIVPAYIYIWLIYGI